MKMILIHKLIRFFFFNKIGQWENVHVIEPELIDDDLMEEEEIPTVSATKKEKGKGRA